MILVAATAEFTLHTNEAWFAYGTTIYVAETTTGNSTLGVAMPGPASTFAWAAVTSEGTMACAASFGYDSSFERIICNVDSVFSVW